MRFFKNLFPGIILLFLSHNSYGQLGWTQKANFPAAGRTLVAEFSIDNFGYIGCGWNGTYYNDFYKWNQVTNTWSAIANYPGVGLWAPTSFSINGKGYVGLGQTSLNAMATDLWCYDPGTNTWTAKATFPTTGWYDASCFVIGHKCWVVCGSNGGPPYNPSVWMYDANANTWTKKANFPGGQLEGTLAFAIGKNGYAGAGWDGVSYHSAMWKYDTTNDTWTPIAPIPARPLGLSGNPRQFVIGSKAYVCVGRDGTGKAMPDGLVYDTVTKAWCQFSDLGIIARGYGASFVINNKGYVGTGTDTNGVYTGPFVNTFYEWSHASTFTAKDTSLCINDSVHFSGITLFDSSETNVTWSWTFTGGSPVSSNAQYPAVKYSSSGTYLVQLIVSSCAGTDTAIRNVHVTINTPVSVKITGSDSACKGSLVTLNAIAPGATSYLWNNGATTSSITFIANSTVIDTVKAFSGGCYRDTSFKVTVLSAPVPIITGKDSVCKGSMVTLTANAPGATSYKWSNGATTSSITFIASSTGIDSVRVWNGPCSNDTSFKVTVIPLPIVVLSGNTAICQGQSTLLSASGGTAYLWTPGNNTNSSITVKPASTTTYTVAVSKGECAKDTSITVTVNIKQGSITPDQVLCKGSVDTLTAGPAGDTYKWSTGATTSSITITANANTTYTVIVSNGCPDTLETSVSVVFAPTLSAAFTNSYDTITINRGDTAYILSTSNVSNYIWSPVSGLSCYTCLNPMAAPTVTTTYTLSADSNGCSTERMVTVFVDVPCADFKVPNVFTPNNDGKNDDFVVNVLNPTSYSIIVYDRWGKEMYSSKDPAVYWNGRILNTQHMVPDGIYYYIIKTTCGSNDYTKKGFVQVIGEN